MKYKVDDVVRLNDDKIATILEVSPKKLGLSYGPGYLVRIGKRELIIDQLEIIGKA